MRAIRVSLALAALTACDGGAPAGGSAGDGGGPRAAGGRERGETLSLACQACHSLNEGGPHLVGPNLYGVFGRAAGTADGFANYSPALEGADFVWSPERLEQWLENPAGFLPGTTMAFTGYRSPEDRAALIAYLVDVTTTAPAD